MKKKKIVLDIFKKRLNLSRVEIAKIENNKIENFELGVHKNWDSLQHVNIISDLEKKMNVKINQKNFDLFSNLKKLLLYLKID